jgi:hypothetical protein
LGGDGVLGDEVPDSVAAEATIPAGREQHVAGLTAAFLHPDPKGGETGAVQWCRPFFPSLAYAADVGAGAELDVVIA